MTDRITELRAMIPSKFRKKSAVIEAFRVGSSRFYPEWLHEAVSANVVVTHAREGSDGWKEPFDHADIQTLEGVMRADRGDWIIRGVEGDLYPCKDSIFRKTYEPAGDGEPPAQQPMTAEQVADLVARLRTMAATGWHPIGDEAANEIERLRAAQQPMGAEQIASACYTYRHDFGLLPEVERHLLMAEARRWADAFGMEVER